MLPNLILCDELFNNKIVSFLLLIMIVCCLYQGTYANSLPVRSSTCMKVLPASKTGTLTFLITLLQTMVRIFHTLQTHTHTHTELACFECLHMCTAHMQL